jgi:hypothetical protein
MVDWTGIRMNANGLHLLNSISERENDVIVNELWANPSIFYPDYEL